QAIDMKAAYGKWLAFIDDGLETPVAIREQSLGESEEQLAGWGLDDRGARDRRPRRDSAESVRCAVWLEIVRRTAPPDEPHVIRQLGDQPDVASCILEKREQIVARQRGALRIVRVGRHAREIHEPAHRRE